MKKITILAIITAILCSCATTKNVKPVAKNELVEVINVFNSDSVDDYIDSVSVYDLNGRLIKLHAEQADEIAVQKAGIYIVVIKSANGLVFVRKCLVADDRTRELRQKIQNKSD